MRIAQSDACASRSSRPACARARRSRSPSEPARGACSAVFFLISPRPPRSTLFPYTTLFRSHDGDMRGDRLNAFGKIDGQMEEWAFAGERDQIRLNSDRFFYQFRHRDAIDFSVDHERFMARSEEHTSELQSLRHLVCRLLLEK